MTAMCFRAAADVLLTAITDWLILLLQVGNTALHYAAQSGFISCVKVSF